MLQGIRDRNVLRGNRGRPILLANRGRYLPRNKRSIIRQAFRIFNHAVEHKYIIAQPPTVEMVILAVEVLTALSPPKNLK